MQQDAIETSILALEKFNIEKDITALIKKEFDKKFSPTVLDDSSSVISKNFKIIPKPTVVSFIIVFGKIIHLDKNNRFQ